MQQEVDDLDVLLVHGAPSPMKWMLSYEEVLAGGNLPPAMVVIIKGAGDPSPFTALPRFLLTPLMRFAC